MKPLPAEHEFRGGRFVVVAAKHDVVFLKNKLDHRRQEVLPSVASITERGHEETRRNVHRSEAVRKPRHRHAREDELGRCGLADGPKALGQWVIQNRPLDRRREDVLVDRIADLATYEPVFGHRPDAKATLGRHNHSGPRQAARSENVRPAKSPRRPDRVPSAPVSRLARPENHDGPPDGSQDGPPHYRNGQPAERPPLVSAGSRGQADRRVAGGSYAVTRYCCVI